jgi:hypothetical protein
MGREEVSNRYMRKPYRCNSCFLSFNTEEEAEAHWLEMHEGATTASETHNRLAPELVKRIITGTDGESSAMVVLESIVLGVMLYYRPKPSHAAEFLDTMTAAVIGRMQP